MSWSRVESSRKGDPPRRFPPAVPPFRPFPSRPLLLFVSFSVFCCLVIPHLHKLPFAADQCKKWRSVVATAEQQQQQQPSRAENLEVDLGAGSAIRRIKGAPNEWRNTFRANHQLWDRHQ
ncbi:hypothetical protein niasHT_037932 [Heterodera trifolii]|uniref:Uncharacterized protein n=1 Tax=Heterodera trifolii TaxID=157864 RepID=A0ABD2HND5_9BILA